MSRNWPLWVFRAVTTLTAVLLFDQAIFAGQYLGGIYSALAVHRVMATVTTVAVLGCVVAGLLLRGLDGNGPLWPVLAGVGLLALTGSQLVAGYQRWITLHVPLGVLAIAAGAVLACAAWRADPGLPPDTPASTGPATAGPADAQPTDTGPTDAQPTHAGPTDAGPTDTGLREAEPATAEPTSAQSTEGRPTEGRAGGVGR